MADKQAHVHIKSINTENDQRLVYGIASSNALDRAGDVLQAKGARFVLPLPFLWQHDHDKPIGQVIAAEIKDDGVHITAQISKILEEGKLKERCDEAWQSIKTGLVKGLSVGFNGLKFVHTEKGIEFQEWEMVELSAVTIPCNPQAQILATKAQENQPENKQPETIPKAAPKKAALTISQPRPKGQKANVKMTLQQQIQAARAALTEKHAQIIAKEAEKLAQDADLSAIEEEAQVLEKEATSIENNIKRLEHIEKMQNQIKEKAVEVPQSPAIVQAQNLPNLEKGVAFAQFVRAKMLSQHEARRNGNYITPAQAAKTLGYSAPVVAFTEKATLGTTTDAGFAKPLIESDTYTGDFLELLRNATIFDKLTGYRNVPFNVKINGQLTGGVAQWVGEGKAKPLTNPTFGSVEIKEHKLAAIVVYTQELLRRADPAIDILVRDDLIQACAELVDKTFLDDQAASDTRPAGMLNGAEKITATGTDAAALEKDLMSMIARFVDNNLSTDGAYILMSETKAMQIALMRDPLGNSYFNGMTFAGAARSLMGIPVITSKSVGDKIILLKTSELLVAQDGGVDIAYSDQATLEDDGTTHRLWQENKFAIRAEKFITWAKRRPIAVAYIGA